MKSSKDEHKGKTVIVGMTGGIDSTVAAYLLKKQGYNIIGISLVTMDRGILKKKEDDEDIISGIKEGVEGRKGGKKKSSPRKKKNEEEEIQFEVTGTCYIEDLRKVKAICDTLDISFYGVDAKDYYKEKVLDYIVTAKLTGTNFSPCIACNKVKMDILLKKAKELGADFVATGHYAKVFKNIQTGECSLLSANDTVYDQSYFLSKVPKEQLKKLILPFGDIRRQEVEKIAETLACEFRKKDKARELCFMCDKKLPNFVEKNSAISLRDGGTIFDYDEGVPLIEHEGIHNFWIGQKELDPIEDLEFNPEQSVLFIEAQQKSVLLLARDVCTWNICQLIRFTADESFDFSKPYSAYAQVSFDSDRVACTVYSKNNDTVIIESEDIQKGLLGKGQSCVLYNKPEIGGKIIGVGEIGYFCVFENGEYMVFPKRELELDELEDEDKKERIDRNILEF